MRLKTNRTCGFTLIEMLVTVAVIAIMSGVAIPLMVNVSTQMKLGASAREVERELQTARAAAVSANQPMRVRFNCPATGQYRMVELIGTPSIPVTADGVSTRCNLDGSYPYPAADRNPLTRPNNDGPVRRLDLTVSFTTSTTIEFWPDGTAHTNTGGTNPWPAIAGAGYSIVLTQSGKTQSILVNGSGKIQLQ